MDDHLIDPKVLLDTPTMPSNTHWEKSMTPPIVPPSSAKTQPKQEPMASKKLPKKEKDKPRSAPPPYLDDSAEEYST
jgi:hypothetical protein